jgi:hypothetical protein
MNLNIYIYAIIVIISIFILYYYQVKRQQMSENFAPIEIEVLPQYKNITPTGLYALFDNDLDKMTRAMMASKIPSGALKIPSYYPKIASILAKNKLI